MHTGTYSPHGWSPPTNYVFARQLELALLLPKLAVLLEQKVEAHKDGVRDEWSLLRGVGDLRKKIF